ncbi:unnamed protein product [Sphagnum balticum]
MLPLMLTTLLLLAAALFPPVGGPNFDFYFFVQMWPGSLCDTSRGCCYPKSGKPESNFQIHGLWPSRIDSSYPSKCGGNFVFSEIKDLTKELNLHWNKLSCPSSNNSPFWNHEWSKHGTCSGLTEHAYFKTALNLYTTYNLTAALASAAILPNGQLYTSKLILKVLTTALGQTPLIECNRSAKLGYSQFYQIYVCVDKDGKSLIPCPVTIPNQCRAIVYFPPF